MLVAHRDGIDLWTHHQITAVLRGQEVEVAVPDLTGGVIFSSWDQGVPGPIDEQVAHDQ